MCTLQLPMNSCNCTAHWSLYSWQCEIVSVQWTVYSCGRFSHDICTVYAVKHISRGWSYVFHGLCCLYYDFITCFFGSKMVGSYGAVTHTHAHIHTHTHACTHTHTNMHAHTHTSTFFLNTQIFSFGSIYPEASDLGSIYPGNVPTKRVSIPELLWIRGYLPLKCPHYGIFIARIYLLWKYLPLKCPKNGSI